MAPVFGHGRLRLYLLKLLGESPRHGYDLIRLLTDRFLGMYAPSAGTIYPRLQRLEAEGLVTHDLVGGRKVYRLTDVGQAELRARMGELDSLEAEIGESVRDLANQVGDEVRETARELHSELDQTVRDMRRNPPDRRAPVWASFLTYLEQRGESRRPAEPAGLGRPPEPPGTPGPSDRPATPEDAEAFLDWLQDFRDQVRDVARDAVRPPAAPPPAGQRPAGVSPEQFRECAEVLANALTQIRGILNRGD